jgi:outer membrane protein assembly factor BamB/predicted phosphodiesterase
MRRALQLVVVLAAARAAAFPVEGTVFADRDGDGVLSAGDEPLPGVRVSFESAAVTTTDANGRYALSPATGGIVWARTPDGYVPGAAWRPVVAAGVVDLPLHPSEVTGPLRFVHASDTHIGNGVPLVDVELAFREAASVEPRPHFLVVTGDITGGETEPQFRDLMTVLAGIDVPFVPVIGNHDTTHNSGNLYRKYLGPREYSFELGGVRVVVLDFAAPVDAIVAFLRRELADLPAGMPVAAFSHMPFDTASSGRLADAGVDTLFTGHWHSNRILEHGGMQEVNTQTLTMGGIDVTPAGYRIAEWTGERFAYTHHTIVDAPVLRVVYPGAGCVPAGPTEVIVAAEAGAPVSGLTAAWRGGPAMPLAPRGGWTFTATVNVDADGTLVVAAPQGLTTTRSICVRAAPAAAPALADWPQLGGGPRHENASERRIAPPLVHAWARPVGGHLRGGSVVVSEGRLFAPVVDLGPGTAGGVVAFDAATGESLWERRVGPAVHSAPAVSGGLVLFGSSDAVVHAVNAADGAEAWRYHLGEGLSVNTSWLYSAPTVAEGIAYVGVQRRFAALDVATGRELWRRDPAPSGFWLGSYSSAGVGGGLVIASFNRGVDGIVAWDAVNGEEVWRVPEPLSMAIHASPVMTEETVYLANSATSVFALDMAPAPPQWTTWTNKIVDGWDNWRYGVVATPALAGGKLIVPTMAGKVMAFHAASGADAWFHDGAPPVIRTAHYQGAGAETFAASPVVTADIVWVGGVDGRLRALDLENGRQLWEVDLGAPIMSAPVPAGEMLYVGTYDGTVHALRNEPTLACPGAPGCPDPPDEDGCTIAAGSPRRGPGVMLIALAAAAWTTRRRRKR